MIKTLLLDELRLLTFRRMSPAIQTHWRAFLVLGLVFTWLAGVGRYWDNPRAHLWQQLGLGSVAYVFILAALLFLLIWPLKPKNWSYRNVLLFVSLTAPPAVLYAFPRSLCFEKRRYMDHVQSLLWAFEKRGLHIPTRFSWPSASTAPDYYDRQLSSSRARRR